MSRQMAPPGGKFGRVGAAGGDGRAGGGDDGGGGAGGGDDGGGGRSGGGRVGGKASPLPGLPDNDVTWGSTTTATTLLPDQRQLR